MENARKLGAWRHLLREITGGLLLLATVVAVRITGGTGYFLIPVALFVLLAAYVIASGANARRAKHASQHDVDRSWASETLARPVWVSVLALTINWMSVIVVVNLLSFWGAPSRETITAIVLLAIPPVAALALALVYFERWQARRALKSTPQ